MRTFQMKTRPFAHQQAELDAHWADTARGILWEQGTGKSKLTLDTMAKLWCAEKISGVLILAPNNVHRNWAVEEVPKHLGVPNRVFLYETHRMGNKTYEAELKSFVQSPAGERLDILVMSYDALMTERGAIYAKGWLTGRECLMVADESARIKNPAAMRTKKVWAASTYAKYRRALTGTPISNGPFDIYAQMRFLREDVWHQVGCRNFGSFKNLFGVWQNRPVGNGRFFPALVEYRNIELLTKTVQTLCSRVTKDDVLDLPPKLYSKRFFDLTPAQAGLYRTLKNEFIAQLDSGEVVDGVLALTRLIRLQQVCSGFVKTDSGIQKIDNPRLALLEELTEDMTEPAIIWARFTHDIDEICRVLGPRAVRYDGQVGAADRALAMTTFQSGQVQFFVAKPATAGEGLTLTATKSVIYYSNDFELAKRLQSEDRAHRIGQSKPVTYIDIIASGTLDEKIVAALQMKLQISNEITGDKVKDWL